MIRAACDGDPPVRPQPISQGCDAGELLPAGDPLRGDYPAHTETTDLVRLRRS
jgi:hypothetical protein